MRRADIAGEREQPALVQIDQEGPGHLTLDVYATRVIDLGNVKDLQRLTGVCWVPAGHVFERVYVFPYDQVAWTGRSKQPMSSSPGPGSWSNPILERGRCSTQ